MIRKFLIDDNGAVSVDYVVLTGSLAGLGLATSTVVSTGVQDLVTDIAAAMGATLSATAETVLDSFDFSAGIGPWIGGQVMNLRNFGEVLVLGPGETTSVTLSFPEFATSGFLTFDVIAGDSLDWESAFFWLDGQLIGQLVTGAEVEGGNISDGQQGSFDWVSSGPNASPRGTEMIIPSVEGVTVTYERLDGNMDLGAQTRWTDEMIRIRVQIDNPEQTMQFSASTNTDQPIDDEFYAIDNFTSSYQ